MTEEAREQREAALMDFRYVYDATGREVEAFQITPKSRWDNAHWPEWMQMQKRPGDLNAVFSFSDNPDVLWISLPTGEQLIDPLGWIVLDGEMRIWEALAFDETHSKVVPVPDLPAPLPAADGVPDEVSVLSVVPLTTKPAESEEVAEYRAAIFEAIKMIEVDTEGSALAALNHLKGGMSKRTEWCDCMPGQCDGRDIWGCRQKSPLLT